jgi:prevent-host-death family protein
MLQEVGFKDLLDRWIMTTIKVGQARSKLGRLVDEAAASPEPILLTGKRTNAVLISEEDWRAIQETLYLLAIPGMRESIREGLEIPI